MKTTCLLLLAFVALGTSASSAPRGLPNEVAAAPEAAYEERAARAIAQRIARAREQFDYMKRTAAADSKQIALFSFARRLPLGEVRSLVDKCACRILELYRTVGETQMSWGIGNDQLRNPSATQMLERDFIRTLERTLTEIDAEVAQTESNSAHSRWLAQKRQAFAKALIQGRNDGLQINGVMIEATWSDVERISAAVQPADLLAVEFMSGTARAFAIPLETYR